MEKIADAVSRMYRGSCELNWLKSSIPVMNDPEVCRLMADSLERVMPAGTVLRSVPDPLMGSDDFTHFAQIKPSAYIFLSSSDPEKHTDIDHHNPKFNIDEVCPSDKYQQTDEIEPYLQCVQHFRRIQLVHMGNRWFDIKRFGFTIQHKIGISEVRTLQVLDPRYAIQIPSEVIGAGLDPNPRSTNAPVQAPIIGREEYVRVSD